MSTNYPAISIVTPTFKRPNEVKGLLENIARQSIPVLEIILVDGADETDDATKQIIGSMDEDFPFRVKYIRHSGGTAIQRNVGIDVAKGEFVALIDDDVRLENDFFSGIMDIFSQDLERKVGGIVGYRTNEHFKASESPRWRWYKRLKLLTVYEPGRYDFQSGYPINTSLQPPFEGSRPVDYMTTACAVWRREVFDSGLRFDTFFRDYGVLEDAHFSLRAGRKWKLLQSGDAHCTELRSPNGRIDRRRLGYKCVVNYYYVFRDIVRPLTPIHKFRFWRYQAFEFFRISASAIRRGSWGDVLDLRGRVDGIFQIVQGLDDSAKT